MKEWISDSEGFTGLEVTDENSKFDLDVLIKTTEEYREKLLARSGTMPIYIIINLDRPDLFRARVGGLANVEKAVCDEFGFSGLQVLAMVPDKEANHFKAKLKQLKRKANMKATYSAEQPT